MATHSAQSPRTTHQPPSSDYQVIYHLTSHQTAFSKAHHPPTSLTSESTASARHLRCKVRHRPFQWAPEPSVQPPPVNPHRLWNPLRPAHSLSTHPLNCPIARRLPRLRLRQPPYAPQLNRFLGCSSCPSATPSMRNSLRSRTTLWNSLLHVEWVNCTAYKWWVWVPDVYTDASRTEARLPETYHCCDCTLHRPSLSYIPSFKSSRRQSSTLSIHFRAPSVCSVRSPSSFASVSWPNRYPSPTTTALWRLVLLYNAHQAPRVWLLAY